MSIVLPRYIALKSTVTQNYVRYKYEDSSTHGLLQALGENIFSPYAKHEVVAASIGRGLVHIRCCYNNKYWRQMVNGGRWIYAVADEPEEDESHWSCTLFAPLSVVGNSDQVQFRHVYVGSHLMIIGSSAASTARGLLALDTSPQNRAFTFTDWESMLVLPRHVAFKSDNDYFLRFRPVGGPAFLEFKSTDRGENTVWSEPSSDGDGRVRIMSNHTKLLWRVDTSSSGYWIRPDSSNSTDSTTLFWPVRVADNVVALKSLGTNRFCRRFTSGNVDSCLSSTSQTIDAFSRLEVEELVLQRTIYDVQFRLLDARIFGERPITMTTGQATNLTTEPNTAEVRLLYVESTSSTWNSMLSLTVGVSTTVSLGIPLIASGEVTISSEFSGSYQWGKTITSETSVETTYTVIVPPMSVVSVRMLATTGSCDVPFSYFQRDTLYDGTTVVYHQDDGLYTGINSYNFTYETAERKLTALDIQQLNLLTTSDQTQEPQNLLPISSDSDQV